MSSIPKINNLGKVKFPKFQANESTTSPRVYLNDDGEDTFQPSFKAGATKVTKPFSSGLIKAGMMVMAGLGISTTQTSCIKREPDNISATAIANAYSDNAEVVALLTQLIGLMQENNAQNAQMINQQAYLITQLANLGVDIKTIIDTLGQTNTHLSDLVQGNDELKDILLRIETIATNGNNIAHNNSVLLSRILATALNIYNNNNANAAEIIALLNQLLGEAQNMSEQQAQYYTLILQAMGNMNQATQAQLLAILNAIHGLDANMQEAWAAALAQLQGMQAAQQQQYLALMQQLQGMETAQQQRFLALMRQLQGMQADQQQQFLTLMNNLTAMQADLQNKFLAIMEQLQGMDANMQASLLAILNRMTAMQEAQQQQFLAIMGQLEHMEDADQAHFIAFMEKLTNLENGQQQILNAMQNLNADFLAKFTEALAKLDRIEANQATQITQLAQIYQAIQTGNAHLNNIEEFIRNLNLGTDVNLDVIESLLQEILDSVNTGNNMLANMDANIDFISQVSETLEAQMQAVLTDQDKLLEWQEAIFNKIPEVMQGCQCEECCEQVIEILIQIDEHIQNGDWTHEGIDDEFDDLLGKKEEN